MLQHMALLVPHLAGKAFALRSAIVVVCAHLVIHLSGEPTMADRSSMRPPNAVCLHAAQQAVC